MSEIPTDLSPNSLLLELTFDARGDLVVRLPETITYKSGLKTLTTGAVETELRNILNIENKIRKAEAFFYGEPDLKTLARDLKNSRITPRANIRSSNAILDLEI